jgi:N-acetylglucosamine kinase-like BadF-type ATPase
MRLFAGIDGGQSSTVAVIGDEHGRVLARGVAGPADEIGQGNESTRLRDALRDALEDARANARLAPGVRFEAVVAGISGYDGRVYGREPDLPSTRVVLVHDTPIALAGALGGSAGVIAIAGTGSVVYGCNDDGWSCTLGGWGFLFGDEGSAFGIARDALALMMRALDDGTSPLERETKAACDFFDTGSLRALVHAFYKGSVTRDRLAAFAPVAMSFDAFAPIVGDGARRLSALIGSAIAAGAPARVAFVGGLFADLAFRGHVREEVLAAVPQAEIVEPRYDPARGALLMAYRGAGANVAELEQ